MRRSTVGCFVVMFAIASGLGVGCARAVEGHAVASEVSGSNESQCKKVDAPLTTVPAPVASSDDSEPTIRVPQPAGWDRVTKFDSAMIRFAMGFQRGSGDDFAASAVVTLESHPGEIDANDFFLGARHALTSTLGTSESAYTDGVVCGLPAETVNYVIPQMGGIKGSISATAVMVVAFTGRTTFGVVMTVQSPKPDDATYAHDADTILTGFQVLAPNSGHR